MGCMLLNLCVVSAGWDLGTGWGEAERCNSGCPETECKDSRLVCDIAVEALELAAEVLRPTVCQLSAGEAN